ncbi:MAG: hypothetical protein CVU09_15640 [Bacteroidetes bacterium HGW-Bacteroidetes-4]|jgi:hypothetical protein|nr:MAG: hypothetical protein CVU09_15640 [Bacteroidetes bacterium HGW-Bacteroidetes-4]
MLIYCEHITPRVSYVFDYVFSDRLGITVELSSDADKFINSETKKLNYSTKLFGGIPLIVPENLLFEKKIRLSKPGVVYEKGIPVIFSNTTEFGFDLFSAVFYFISRYEEYQPFETDLHGRFPAKESLAFKHIFLNQPVVDYWIMLFKDFLNKNYPKLKFKEEQYEQIPTIDVDSPWCYRNKGFIRNTLGLLRDLLKFEINKVLLRLLVLMRLKPDPWFVFNKVNCLFANNHLNPHYFIHVGHYGKFDKTVRRNKLIFRHFVKKLDSFYPVALHPSYKSSGNLSLLKSECLALSKIVDKPISQSRQHFLKFKLPDYYQMLIAAGITNDFSMGFADKPGFRAGTSRPFYWYDLKKESKTILKVHPFAIMDRTLVKYQHITGNAAKLVYEELKQQVQQVNGLFVTLWHNESLGNQDEWKGWYELFMELMKKN